MSENITDEAPYLTSVTDDFPGGNKDDLVEWAFDGGMAWCKAKGWHVTGKLVEGAPFLTHLTDDFPGGNDDDIVEWAFDAGVTWQQGRS